MHPRVEDVPVEGGSQHHRDAAGRSQAPAPSGMTSWLAARLLGTLLKSLGSPQVEVELWEGTRVCVSPTDPVARVIIHKPHVLWKLCWNPKVEFGEAYTRGDLSVEGDLEQLLVGVFLAAQRSNPRPNGYRRIQRYFMPPHRNTHAGSRHNIHHHYDLGNDFYQLWLDRRMVYTCAYFADPWMSLEEAQLAKLHHVCRKLRLEKGQRVIEAGCGWGALAIEMARQYGVRVEAYNISREQIQYARAWAKRLGLADRVRFVEADWREIRGKCDAFVSVGMLEHVGVEHYESLGRVIEHCLAPHGKGLIHSIGQVDSRPMNAWIEKRVFPGAYPPTLTEMMRLFEPFRFSVLDVENLRLHYAQTLRCWLQRFEAAASQVTEMFDERFVRAWRLYLNGSIAGFEAGALHLYQVVFARAGDNSVPWTRDEVYRTRFSPVARKAQTQ